MKALITGASSGIGRDMARVLSSDYGYDLILVARDRERLQELKQELKTNIQIVLTDLSDEKKVKELYVLTQNENIDLLINNAGFGDFGDYRETNLPKELDMINVNIKAVHILTKTFLKYFESHNGGRIINVASIAGLLPGGPLMSTYYATKSYVTSFTLGIYEELRRNNSNIKISAVCPGPVATNFDNVAGVKFSLKQLSSEYVARYSLEQAIKKNKLIIIPGATNRLLNFFKRLTPTKLLLKMTYKSQRRKR